MNILFATWEMPWPVSYGAVQRSFHIARGLARRHSVRMLTFNPCPIAPETERAFLEASGVESAQVVLNSDCEYHHEPEHGGWPAPHELVLGMLRSPLPLQVRAWRSRAFARALEEHRRSGWVDVVWGVKAWMAEMAREAGFPRVVVDSDDLLSVITQQQLDRRRRSKRLPLLKLENSRLRRYERRMPYAFDRTVVAKPEDLDFFDPRARDRISVVPNGVRIPPLAPAAPRDASSTILFVGTLNYGPNVDAIEYFAQSVLPQIWAVRPDVRFVVAGRGTGKHLEATLADPRCTIVESAPDLAPYYAAADLVVAPVRIGGGTRIKILEALAYARPLVSTRFAAEGIDLRPGIDVEFADRPDEMAARCLALLADPEAGARLGAAGRARVAERYDWASIETHVSTLLG